jgi:hypothetical protein
MTESNRATIADKRESLQSLIQARDFRRLCRVSTELSKHKQFNIFRLANKTINENAWSKVFAWLLSSTADHELELRPLLNWLRLSGGNRFTAIRNNAETVLTTNEFATKEGRRLDILIRVIDKESRLLAIIGIENKLWSDEQTDQVGDYQKDLDIRFSRYPGISKQVIFLTPDGREANTANNALQTCPCVSQGYSTIIDLCDSLIQVRGMKRGLKQLIEQMKNYLQTEIDTTRAEKHARELVRRLYADERYRGALRLIARHKPSTSDLLEKLQLRMQKALKQREPYLEHYWITQPPRHNNPHDLRLCLNDLDKLTYRGQSPVAINYILTCDKDEPDIGDAMKMIVAAWCKNKAAVQRATKLIIQHEPIPWREGMRKEWVTIWTGNQYRLKDLGEVDSKALSILLLDAVDQSHESLLRRLQHPRPILPSEVLGNHC